MKRFLRLIFVSLVVLVAADILCGAICHYLNAHAKGGSIANRYYICTQCDADIIMMGSSRMHQHYDPSIMEDSTGYSCYNTGENGNGIILAYSYLKLILTHHVPRMIIYDITEYDLYEDDNVKYLQHQKAYCDNEAVRQVCISVDPSYRYKLYSGFFRYNSDCLRLLVDYFHPATSYEKGFYAEQNVMQIEPSRDIPYGLKKLDETKLKYLSLFSEECKAKGIKLVWCISPWYCSKSSFQFCPDAGEVARSLDIPFYDFQQDPTISSDPRFFANEGHMNCEGAKQFTTLLINNLRQDSVLVCKQ